MTSIHPKVSGGDGTQASPFVITAAGNATAAIAEREVIEKLCGTNCDETIIRREYHGEDLCATFIRDGNGERVVWFDLSAPRKGSEVMRDFIRSPESRELNKLTAKAREQVISEIVRPQRKGFLLFLFLILALPIGCACIAKGF